MPLPFRLVPKIMNDPSVSLILRIIFMAPNALHDKEKKHFFLVVNVPKPPLY